jgi:hypothetical protein
MLAERSGGVTLGICKAVERAAVVDLPWPLQFVPLDFSENLPEERMRSCGAAVWRHKLVSAPLMCANFLQICRIPLIMIQGKRGISMPCAYLV